MHLHFSLYRFGPDTVLGGRKYMHKRRQRVGQRLVDEVFEHVRKAEFAAAPSLFTSLWTTSALDPAIPRKAFAEDASAGEGFLYEVAPHGPTYQVEACWEVAACRAVTQSDSHGAALIHLLEDHARRFWRPELVETDVLFFLCAGGARVVREVRLVRKSDVDESV